MGERPAHGVLCGQSFIVAKLILELGVPLGGSFLSVRYSYECCLLQFCVWMLFIRFVNVGNS